MKPQYLLNNALKLKAFLLTLPLLAKQRINLFAILQYKYTNAINNIVPTGYYKFNRDITLNNSTQYHSVLVAATFERHDRIMEFLKIKRAHFI